MRGNAIGVLLILSLLLFSSAGAASWDFRGYEENTSSTTESGPAPPLKEIHTNYEIGGDWLAPIVHGDVVYLVRSHRNVAEGYPYNVMAINMSDGKILWIHNNSKVWGGAESAFYKWGMIFVDTGWWNGFIEAVNATTGKTVWERKGVFSSNIIPYANSLYFVEREKESGKNATKIISVNPFTGKEKGEVEINTAIPVIREYISISNGTLYVFNNEDGVKGGHSLYAVNLTTGKVIWEYTIKNTFTYLMNSPMVVGKDMLYIPVWLNIGGGVAAINKTTGKLEWERITSTSFDDFQYKFAYSPEYHMIVRANISGYLIAMDSRDGHVLWISHVNDSKYAGSLGNVVIAHNYIYEYVDAWKYPNDMYNETEVGLLRLYNITNGKMVYQKELYAGGGDKTSLDLPGMAVTHGKVILPEGYLQILEHGNGTESEQPNIFPWLIGLSAVIVGGALAAAIIRKKNKS